MDFLLQVNQTGSSQAMELEGAKRCFDYLQKVARLVIKVFVSDRHRGIAKWVRECQPSVDHYFDQWHIAKGLVKKLLAASKRSVCIVDKGGKKSHLLVFHLDKTWL